MKKIITILFLFSLAYGQNTTLRFTRAALDLTYGKGFTHWGTTNWDNTFVPYIPAGNPKPKNFYTRFNWRDIESSTTQGSYSWTVFDAFVNQAIDSGAMFTFGVMIECNACGVGGQLPAYVVTLESGEGKPSPTVGGDVQPNYQSTNLVTRYNALLHAIANHIASTSRSSIPFSKALLGFDLRHYGEFGEGNGFPTGTNTGSQVPSTAQITTLYMTQMVDSAISIFPNVQLTIPMSYVAINGNDYNLSDGNTDAQSAYHVLTSTNNYGRIGWRRDNIGDDGYNAYLTGVNTSYLGTPLKPLIMNMWQLAPIGGEPAQDFGGTSRCGSIQCDLINEINLFGMSHCGNGNYPIAVNNNTAMVGGDGKSQVHPGDSLRAHVVAGSSLMGAKLALDSASITANPTTGAGWNITSYWKNIGITPVYEKQWKIIYELWNASTSVVAWRDTSKFSPRLFLPQATDSVFADHFSLAGVAAATYNLHIRIADSVGYKNPLPIAITGVQSDGSYIMATGLVVTTSSVPTANAGPDRAITLPTSSTTGDGTGSSGSITTYAWTQLSGGPNSATITNGATATATFSGLIAGTYAFQLSVNSGVSKDTMLVIVSPAAPGVANAGADQNVTLPTSTVTLDGSRSTGSITSYSWTRFSGPNTPSITTPTTVTTTVTGLIAGTYVFVLSVNGGTSTDSINVVVQTPPTPPVTSSVFTTQTPAAGPVNDGSSVTLGMKWSSSVSGSVTGVRFYKGSGTTGTHTGVLYDLSGNVLASVAFTGETSSGWQTMSFATPVPINVNQVYIIAYWTSSGIYEDDDNFFASSSVVSGSLTGLKNGTNGGNGVYIYGASPAFPTTNFQATNYWADIIFASSQSPPCNCHVRDGINVFLK